MKTRQAYITTIFHGEGKTRHDQRNDIITRDVLYAE